MLHRLSESDLNMEGAEVMPNKRVNGWDERDYKLWSKLQQLASYGIIQPDDRMISRDDVVKLLECESEERFRAAHVQSREKEPK